MLRIRPLVLMLRYSGMRIGDAVGCAVERLNGTKLLLYTQKTGVPVYCPLPDFVVSALEEMLPTSERYFFWTGGSKLQTATGDWQAKLKKLFEKANIADGHAHRFRDTFAVELLLANVPDRTGFNSAGTYEHPHYGEALHAVGTRTTGAGRSGRTRRMGAGSGSSPRNEGYARGTREERCR